KNPPRSARQSDSRTLRCCNGFGRRCHLRRRCPILCCCGLVARVEPGLEHQDVPDGVMPFTGSGDEIAPNGADKIRVDESIGSESALFDERFGPIAQRPTQPIAQRYAESVLLTLR